MPNFDLDQLLEELSNDSPCGANLEYDPMYGDMERAAAGTQDQQYGDTVVAAEEPDWREVSMLALQLFARTKDLRIAVYLATSLLRTEGILEFRNCLALLAGLVDRYWDSIHPQLDPDDENDPTIRINALATLTDEATVMRPLREAAIVHSSLLGKFSYRDILVAEGELPTGDEEKRPELSTIDAAFESCELDDLQEMDIAVRESIDHVRALDATLTERVGTSQAPTFEDLIDLLDDLSKVVSKHLARRSDTGAEAGNMVDDGGEESFAAPRSPDALSGEIQSRNDVIRVLDKVCEYYERNEPSSPVPLLLRRAKGLVNRSFIDIIRDLSPDSISQIETISGTGDSANSSDDD